MKSLKYRHSLLQTDKYSDDMNHVHAYISKDTTYVTSTVLKKNLLK